MSSNFTSSPALCPQTTNSSSVVGAYLMKSLPHFTEYARTASSVSIHVLHILFSWGRSISIAFLAPREMLADRATCTLRGISRTCLAPYQRPTKRRVCNSQEAKRSPSRRLQCRGIIQVALANNTSDDGFISHSLVRKFITE